MSENKEDKLFLTGYSKNIESGKSFDIMASFEEYLIFWCEKKHFPLPTDSQPAPKIWAMAWKGFLQEVLRPNWKILNSQYKQMNFKTKADSDMDLDVVEDVYEPVLEDSEDLDIKIPITKITEKSGWDLVSDILNDL